MANVNHFQVAIRCHPSSEEKAWRVQNNCIELPGEGSDANADTPPQVSFTFDRVLTEDYSHAKFYETVIAPSIKGLVKGESSNVAILTYGLPCTGKTHTVFGTSGQTRVKPEARGVIMRCGEQLFRELGETPGTTSRVVATFCHVFESEEGKKSRVADLFDMKKRDLEIVEDSNTLQLFSIHDLTEQSVTSPQDILGLVEKGYLMRNATGCVKDIRKPMMKPSTVSQPLQQYRPHTSHAIFTLKCERIQEGRNEVSISHIIIADLAGKGIEQIHSENACSDSGIKVLHNILNALREKGSPVAAANTLFPQSSLTKLLKPSLGGNYDTILIGNVCLKASSLDLTKKCLKLLSESRKVKNFTKVVKIPVDQSGLGKCLKEGKRARAEITQKLGIDTVAKRIEIIGGDGIKVDDLMYKDVSSSTLDLAKRVVSAESQLTCDGEPMQKSISSAPQRPLLGQPSAMVRPSYTTSVSLTTAAITSKATQPTTDVKLKAPSPLTKTPVAWKDTNTVSADDKPTSSQQDAEATSSASSSSLEGSDSESDDKGPTTPVIAGSPPPPLRGIPHLNPDAVDINDKPSLPQPAVSPTVTAVLPSQSRPIPPQHLAMDGFPEGGHQPKLHPVPLLSIPRSNFQRSLAPQAASILHGQAPSTSTYTPLAAVVPPSPTRKTSLTLQQGTKPTEGNEERPSVSTGIEQPTHLSREPRLVSPRSHAPKSLLPLPSPVAVAPAAATATTPSTPAAVQTTDMKPPIAPAQQEPLQEQDSSSNQLKAELESRDDSSSESSDESLSSDNESMDLQEEARDSFDTRIQPRPLQRLQPMRHNFASLHLVDSGARGEMGGPTQLSVLPPISPSSSGGNRSGVLPPLRTAPPQIAPNHPPAYRETSNTLSVSSTGPPNYSSLEGRGRGPTSRGEPFNPPDLSQYISNEEIHVAAMEGVSNSQMKSLAIQYGVDFRDHGGRTPLMYTIIGNQPKLCATLIKLKAAVNAQDSTGMSPLLWATFNAKPDIIKILLRNGADIHHVDPAGQSAFHWAMKTPNIDCLKLLCKYINSPVMVNQPDNNGLTPLHWAVMSDQPAHVQLFLTSTNADVCVQDRDGRTALNFAVLNFSPACIQAILDRCESAINLIDNKGRTALHYACAEGSADCVRTLLTYRSCDLQCADNRGTTPLHWAAAANQSGLVQLLLRRGADRMIRDYDNMLPLDYAEQRGHNDCVKLLQSYGHRRPLSAASQVALAPHTATPTLDEHGHVQLKNPTRRFSLSRESMTSFDHRLPADGQAQSEISVVENAEVESREDGEGEQWANSRQLSTSSGGMVPPPQQGVRGRRPWIRFLLCGCASQRDNAVAPLS